MYLTIIQIIAMIPIFYCNINKNFKLLLYVHFHIIFGVQSAA